MSSILKGSETENGEGARCIGVLAVKDDGRLISNL